MSTTTPNRTDPMSRLYRTRWFMPAFSLFLGALMFVAFWVGDNPADGAFAAGVMAFVARCSTSAAAARRPSPASAARRATSAGSASTSTPPRWPASSSSSSSSAPGSSRSPRAGTAARTRSSAPSAASRTSPRWRSCAGAPSRRSTLPAERQGPGGPSGLQNRQAVVARRLEGSIPSPLRLGRLDRSGRLKPPAALLPPIGFGYLFFFFFFVTRGPSQKENQETPPGEPTKREDIASTNCSLHPGRPWRVRARGHHRGCHWTRQRRQEPAADERPRADQARIADRPIIQERPRLAKTAERSGQSPKRRISRTGRADSARWRTGRRRRCGRRCR